MAPRQAIPMPSGSIEPPEASPDVFAPQGGETGDANSSPSDPAPSIDPATERVVDPATPRTPPKRRKKRKKPKATPAVAAPAGSSPDEEPTTASAPEQRKTPGDEAGGGPDAGHDADDRGENEAPSPDAESVQ
jgi:hypothetical protein